MRLLVISNFYPPHFVGGYELGCRDVVEGLRERGWDVTVLTSRYGVSRPTRDQGVERVLHAAFPPAERAASTAAIDALRRRVVNRRLASRASRRLQPDVVQVWNPRYLGLSAALAVQSAGLPVSFFVSDSWLAEADPGDAARLDLRHAQFASEHLRRRALEAGRPVQEAEVAHWGVDLGRFQVAPGHGDPKRLLYVGQLLPEKGVQVALRALRLIHDGRSGNAPTLTIVGGPDYYDRTRRLVEQLRLGGSVRLTGLVPREDLPEIYAAHDVLIFPSSVHEGFSITLLEAMATGLAVVTTVTGGNAELAEHEVNCLTFEPEDPAGCAAAVVRLLDDPALARALGSNARSRVDERFRLETMIDAVERNLMAAVASRGNA